jgi:hypothetical protein
MDNTLLNGYNPNTVFVGYSPNDFFYSNAADLGIMPNDNDCAIMKPYDLHWDVSCNEVFFQDVSYNCIRKELCKNKDYVNKIVDVNKGNASYDEKYYNSKEKYDRIFMNTINLAIGCLFLFKFIFS